MKENIFLCSFTVPLLYFVYSAGFDPPGKLTFMSLFTIFGLISVSIAFVVTGVFTLVFELYKNFRKTSVAEGTPMLKEVREESLAEVSWKQRKNRIRTSVFWGSFVIGMIYRMNYDLDRGLRLSSFLTPVYMVFSVTVALLVTAIVKLLLELNNSSVDTKVE